jgi:hypothetical protein
MSRELIQIEYLEFYKFFLEKFFDKKDISVIHQSINKYNEIVFKLHDNSHIYLKLEEFEAALVKWLTLFNLVFYTTKTLEGKEKVYRYYGFISTFVNDRSNIIKSKTISSHGKDGYPLLLIKLAFLYYNIITKDKNCELYEHASFIVREKLRTGDGHL